MAIYTNSRTMASIGIKNKRKLSKKIHSASSIDEIIKTVLNSLESTKPILDHALRRGIKDVIQRKRFDLLLLPQYFDCEEVPRLKVADEEEGNEEEEDHIDCAICLYRIQEVAMSRLSCNHSFCTECIQLWMEQNLTCPTCRCEIRQTTHDGQSVERRESLGVRMVREGGLERIERQSNQPGVE